MRPLQALLKARTIQMGGTAGTFDQGPYWRNGSMSWSPPGPRESIETSFETYVEKVYKSNGIVFACIGARARVFSEARFQYQQLRDGRPGDLFGTADLALLENPWPNGTTGELLFRMEQDGSVGGNFFATQAGSGSSLRIRRLRPDWVTIVSGLRDSDPGAIWDPKVAWDIDAELLGYIYQQPGGAPQLLTPDRVVHFSPIPDPIAQWRGMSWITPVIREVMGDSAATDHKLQFFENGTSANFVATYDAGLTRDQFLEYVAAFKEAHQGTKNAYKTIHLGGGTNVTPISADLRQVDFKAVQGAGETRIAAASGAGAVVAMLSEGMQGSALNTGNYTAAKRQFADMTIRPLWRSAAAALQKFAPAPAGSRLWYDARDIPFLQQDQTDAADIQAKKAGTIRQLVEGGFEPASVIAAVEAEDFTLLKHSGLLSVQLQEPGSTPPEGSSR